MRVACAILVASLIGQAGRPFDGAQGRPFDSAQGRPFDFAQGRQLPVFRARTDLVRLDVVVVDAEGHAVHGLTRDDFEVIDRGRSQQVTAFDEVSHIRPADSLLPATLKLDVADNSGSRPDRLIIIVLDDLHFQARTREIKAMARRIVTDIGPRASLGLVTTSGVFGVEPTEDRALLLAEIDRFLDRFDPEGRRLAPGATMPVSRIVGARGPADPPRFFGDMGAYKTVEDVARKIGADPGRRNAFVWVSGGMNAAVAAADCGRPDVSGFYCGALGGLLDALRKANVAGYSITTSEFEATLLKDVAEASGGFVMNATHFDRDLPMLIDDLDHYYLIGFYPDDTSDRKFHPVEVRVKKPGVTVRYRRGYKPGNPPRPRSSSTLGRLSEGVLPVADLPLRLTATTLPPAQGQKTGTVITLEVRADRSRLAEPDGHLRDVLKYEVWAVDLRKKKPVKSVARQARFVLNPAEAAAASGDPLTYQVNTLLTLDPGRYQLRASATSAKVGVGGSVFYETEIPDFNREPRLSDIVIGYDAGPRVPIVGGGLGADRLPIWPTLDREFAREDDVRFVCELAKRALGPVDVTVELLHGSGEPVKRIFSRRVGRAEPSRIDVTVPLKDLAPGGYRLRITATEDAIATEREAGFVVK